MLRSILTLVTALAFSLAASAQFAPQVPLSGNDGIPYNSPLIQNWATACTLYRGWLDIADKSLGQPTAGTEASALGASDADILSLGDSGVAVLTFPYAIKNGAGPDFAIFENGFPNPQDAHMAYLEFAFVEVSSDGTGFTRFPATCNIQDTLQSDNFTYSDASLVHNLAGKYIGGYGTPFDLEELKNTPGLNVNHITHVRIVDVVGSIDPLYGSRDKNDRIINDPYPSVYPSGGFDLNAVGVLHSDQPTGIAETGAWAQLRCFPNPAKDFLCLDYSGTDELTYHLYDPAGRTLLQGSVKGHARIGLEAIAPGLYFLQLDNGNEKTTRKIHKQ